MDLVQPRLFRHRQKHQLHMFDNRNFTILAFKYTPTNIALKKLHCTVTLKVFQLRGSGSGSSICSDMESSGTYGFISWSIA
jgi:hypothetical protein